MARKHRRVLAQRRAEAAAVAAMRQRARERHPGFDPKAAADKALGEAGERPVAARSAAGDPRRLRGIPMIGGCAGAIPGTMPGRGRIERWRPRGR